MLDGQTWCYHFGENLNKINDIRERFSMRLIYNLHEKYRQSCAATSILAAHF